MPYVDVFTEYDPGGTRICNPVLIYSDDKLETVHHHLITIEEYQAADKDLVKAWDKLAKKFAKIDGSPQHKFGKKIREPEEI